MKKCQKFGTLRIYEEKIVMWLLREREMQRRIFWDGRTSPRDWLWSHLEPYQTNMSIYVAYYTWTYFQKYSEKYSETGALALEIDYGPT